MQTILSKYTLGLVNYLNIKIYFGGLKQIRVLKLKIILPDALIAAPESTNKRASNIQLCGFSS
jgi:hypothetical protein